jgi:hypothetical protein
MNQQDKNVLEDPDASNFKAEDCYTLNMVTAGSSKNSGDFLQEYILSHPRNNNFLKTIHSHCVTTQYISQLTVV